MVDELIREITEPEEAASIAAKADARDRLLAAARADAGRHTRKRLRLGRRGLAAIVALVAVPTGVAVATGLARDDGQALLEPADCPELLAGLEQRELSTRGLVLADCPVGAEVDRTLDLLAEIERRRAEIEGDGEGVVAVGRSADGELWSLGGIAGEGEGEAPSDGG